MKIPEKSPRTTLDPAIDVRGISTERENPRSRNLDTLPALEIAKIINREDQSVAIAVQSALPEIAAAIESVVKAFSNGGRLIYVGTGTSGRLGALDSAECPPTFNTDPRLVQYVIAGGDKALGSATEANEDSPEKGRSDLAKRKITKKDVVCGIAASGRTPYTIAALEYAREKGATTICVTANKRGPIIRIADIAIAVEVGPEVISGSTRMKAGTMEKLVLNTITTGAFTRLGYVFGNLMVNVHLKNRKLVERGVGIVQKITGLERPEALTLLDQADGSVPVAVVMHATGADSREAAKRLKASRGNVRLAITRQP